MKNKLLKGMPVFALVFTLIVGITGCSSSLPENPDLNEVETPTIITQPQGGDYEPGNNITLTVVASVKDGGTLSYLWYSNTTNSITGGRRITPRQTNASYTFSLDNWGDFYYYVEVTNTNAAKETAVVNSNVAKITVKSDNAEPPTIKTQPQGRTYYLDDTVTMSVVAETVFTNTGILSYQWYKNTTASNTGGEEITGEDAATYSFTAVEEGTFYYYVVVTNTDNTAIGEKATATVSDPVIIRIEDHNPFDDLTANVTLTVNNSGTANRFQYVRGYGGMDNVEFRLGNGSPSPDMTVEDIRALFDKDPIVVNAQGIRQSGGLGLNFLRMIFYDDMAGIVNRKPGETPGPVYGPGPSGSQPAQPSGWTRDNSDYYDHIKTVNELGGYVLVTPWTFPVGASGFKTSGSSGIGNSGYINTARFNELADYFVNFLQDLNSRGAPIFAFSIQNEYDTTVAYEGCRWQNNDQRDFIRILGPKIANIPGYGGGKEWNRVWLSPGENASAPEAQVNTVINDNQASQYVNFVARHFYGGMQTRYATGINAGKEVWQTEHTDTTNANRDSSYPQMASWDWVWHVANEIYCSTGLNDESAYIWWYAKRFYGFLGDTGNNSGTTWSAVLPRGYVMSHFSKYAADTTRIRVTASGLFVQNLGTNAAAGAGGLTGTTLPVSSSNSNPGTFANGNSDTAGQNQPTAKVLAFEGDEGNSIIVIAFTPTRNSGAGGQDAGNVQIDLPAGFTASKAELMRSNATVKHQMEEVPMNRERNAAIISLPRSNIVSVKFTK